MSRNKLISLALFVGAIVVLAVGVFSLHSAHMKAGLGFIVLGIICIAIGLFAFLSRSTTNVEMLDKEWV
ncbi:MAG TPA: hypothetical protein VEH81_02070 [Ktedonobacteraceae bacterium]|nr:hypothetical protein [Ktedonobacteraceae bacterium]